MPIPYELREFYRGAWIETRNRLLSLAGDCCEWCDKPNRKEVWQVTGIKLEAGRLVPVMLWTFGPPFEIIRCPRYHWRPWRLVETVLTIAHLDHTPGHDTDENLRALCQWCHLHYDEKHHHETRAKRKDAQRPLLVMRAAS